MGYIITMKRMIFKHLLRAKYMARNKFFWKLSSAIAYAERGYDRSRVWSIDYKPVYRADGPFRLSNVHPDAANFNTNI